MVELFSVPMFFIIFREALEAAVVVSVLVSFISRMDLSNLLPENSEQLKKKLNKMVWLGTAAGLGITIILGTIIIFIWYQYGKNIWEGAELLWEAIFGMIATIFITITALSMLKSHQITEHLTAKLHSQLQQEEPHRIERSLSDSTDVLVPDDLSTVEFQNDLNKLGKGATLVFFWVPFLTVLREGLEGMVFVGGVAISEPPSSIPIAAICGLLLGIAVGLFVHYGGSKLALRWFFIISSYLLLLLAAGLISKSEGFFEDYFWSLKVAVDPDAGDANFFDPRVNVWMLPCCKRNSGIWAVLSALLGWRDVATIGTVVIYCCYWLLISAILILMRIRDRKKED